jgi:uncharacterized protein (DUF302 family)
LLSLLTPPLGGVIRLRCVFARFARDWSLDASGGAPEADGCLAGQKRIEPEYRRNLPGADIPVPADRSHRHHAENPPMLKLKQYGLALVLAGGLISQTAIGAGGYAVYTSDAEFADVMEGLKMAIQERGMYINNVMNMGEMLDRTGKDLGMDTPLYDQAESIEFCSAVLSREMSTENPAHVVNCPFIIAVYTLPGETDATYVAHREIPPDQIETSPAMAKVAEMLRSISEAAVSW